MKEWLLKTEPVYLINMLIGTALIIYGAEGAPTNLAEIIVGLGGGLIGGGAVGAVRGASR